MRTFLSQSGGKTLRMTAATQTLQLTEMSDVSTNVSVKEFEENSRILIERGNGDESTRVELCLVPWDDYTYVR